MKCYHMHCNCCGYEFFAEEGCDEIICPMCEAIRYDDEDDYIIEQTLWKL